MRSAEPVVIVGAAMAGLRTAEQLRTGGWDGPIIVIGDEPHLPYNRPPLSKEALSLSAERPIGEWHDTVAFRLRPSVSDVHWRLGRTVVAADLTARTVKLDDGEALGWSGLAVASGLRPRRLPADWPTQGRVALRTLDDAIALRAGLRPGVRVVIVGAGFIGCEVAASARRLGCEVTVVEPLDAPLVRGLGNEVGTAVRRYHERSGIRFRMGRGVVGLASEGERVAGVRLDDGEELPADLVLEAIGAVPNVEWLEGNGLDLGDGVLCDASLRVEGRSGVVAAGDVARYPNARYAIGAQRIEHWSNPTDTAKRAASTLLADIDGAPPTSTPFAPLPSFWSDQGDLRLQSFGSTCIADAATVVDGRLDPLDDGAVVEYTLGSELVGVLLINQPPKTFRAHRARVDAAYLSIDGRNPR
ncbi:NAD(P)/FAD-dependent oxidoreductase [Solicola gregarius]|uniref:FAD-dependent oxidoreductase n=1 Tax=Solicola gregarius TaxID=2908642 RepID=A0AA46TGS6_9ACTN|nr:FAD-dependent oxidoreductase [Solicola gregarius]UYM04908.1 FAD-dependent oxidoreductase [Solicola gregarius]